MSSPRTAREELNRALVVWRRSLSYWKRALLVFVVGAVVSVPFVFTRPRLYRSETVILYQETIRSADLTGGEGSGEGAARRVGARLREVLLSRASLEPIIKELGLYFKDPDRRELVEAVEEMRKHIRFKAREGDTFEIAFDGSTPDEAQEVTRRLGDCIIQEAASRRTEGAKTLKEFLSAETDRNAADLRVKEAELAKFVALYPELAARLRGQPPSPGASPIGPTTGPSDPQLASLEARAARIERQLARANKAEPAPPPPPKPPPFQPPPDSPELVSARRDLADKSARYTEKHPDVIAARARLRAAEDAQAALNAAAAEAHAAAIASAARAQADEPPPKNAADEAALRQQLAELHAQITHRRAALVQVDGGARSLAAVAVPSSPVELEVEFRRLERDVNEGRERQRQLDEKLFKASITASSVMNDRNIQVSILDPAYYPSAPVSKSRTLMLAVLLAASLVLAIATALLSAKLDDRIHDRADLEQLGILPVVGVIPRSLPPKA
ncbi:MAG: hypothetical protein KF795_14995 [Labilithrix sp.]|nr:hypothetical protein [Labilithrix sp.]